MVWLILVGICFALLFAVLVSRANKDVTDDASAMIGLEGEAIETFSSDGMVRVRGELWRATTPRGIIERGRAVRVVALRPGLVLVVEKVPSK
jgi:membrane-bound serine protease (ClpP class)